MTRIPFAPLSPRPWRWAAILFGFAPFCLPQMGLWPSIFCAALSAFAIATDLVLLRSAERKPSRAELERDKESERDRERAWLRRRVAPGAGTGGRP